MQVVYRHRDPTKVNYYAGLLRQFGIPTFTKNEIADPALAGVGNTITDWLPALCILNPADYMRAREIIQEANAEGEARPQEDWKCNACLEEVPKELTQCWNCGADHAGLLAAGADLS